MGKKLDKIEQRKRERRLIEYRTVKGYSDAEIAVIEGYGSVSAATRAINAAIRKLPAPPTYEQVRRDNEVTGDYLRKLFTRIAEDIQPMHTSIGRIMWNPVHCDCPNQGVSQDRKEHTPDCAIVPVMDYGTAIRAGEALRKLGDSKADSARMPIPYDIAMQQVNEFLASLPLPPEPQADYTVTAELVDGDDGHLDYGDDGQVHD